MTRKVDYLKGTRPPVPGVDFLIPFNPDGSINWPEPDPESPFFITGPALISFSGGRTSAMMLFLILWAHGGKLPADVYVCFANTGKEREETLRFVYEIGLRFGITIHWLQWRHTPERDPKTNIQLRFEEVGFNSAARQGEPFLGVIKTKQFLPSPVLRYCTQELKIRVMRDFMISLGIGRWTNVIGLRADEVRRIMKAEKRNDAAKERFTTVSPLFKAGIMIRDVWKFWLGGNADPKRLTEPLPLGFDLGLYPYEGNCDDCFLKDFKILVHQERERPGTAQWWIAVEQTEHSKAKGADNQRFRKEFTYQDVADAANNQPLLIELDWRELEFDAECGVSGTDTRIKCGAKK